MSHIGFTRLPVKYGIAGTGVSQNPNYGDWYVGIAKEFGENLVRWRTTFLVAGTFHRAFDVSASLISDRTRDLGKPALILGIERVF